MKKIVPDNCFYTRKPVTLTLTTGTIPSVKTELRIAKDDLNMLVDAFSGLDCLPFQFHQPLT